jgi:hypothetical protein
VFGSDADALLFVSRERQWNKRDVELLVIGDSDDAVSFDPLTGDGGRGAAAGGNGSSVNGCIEP